MDRVPFQLPTRVHEAMQMQVEAERRKRAAILESEGVREAEINIAEGKRKSRILASGKRQCSLQNVPSSYIHGSFFHRGGAAGAHQ